MEKIHDGFPMAKRRSSNSRKTTQRWEAIRFIAGRSTIALLWLMVLAGIGGAWMWGVPKLESRASAATTTEPIEIVFHNLPAWLKGADLDALRLRVARNVGMQAMDRNDLLAIKSDLEHSGWFESVSQVVRPRRDRIEIDAVAVTPFALVRDEAGDHLIDSFGRLLPRTAPAGSMPQFMVMVRPQRSRPASPGEAWGGTDLEAGMALISRLSDLPWLGQIAAIDLGDYSNAGILVIVSNRGCRIRWGAAPGREGAREVPAAQKIKYLQHHFETTGHIDHGYSAFDLSGDYVPAG